MVEGAARKRRLAAIGGQADNPPAPLDPQMRQCGAYELDRPEEICRELVCDLLVAKFLCCAEESIARIADDHIDSAKLSEGFVHYATKYRQVGHVEIGPATNDRRNRRLPRHG